MKKIAFITIILLINSIVAVAQNYSINLDAKIISDYEILRKGLMIHVNSLNCEENVLNDKENTKLQYNLALDGNVVIKVNGKIGKKIEFMYHNVQDIWDAAIICNVLDELQKKGIQEKLRAEMESDALEYIYKVKSNGLELNDPYLESYIYSLVSQITPKIFIDGRPCNVNILIVDDPSMNAGMFPNGTLVINSGLIAGLHTEDELVAVLSHEIGHFVLDHSVQNVNKARDRKKRAEFWGALATGVVGVAEGIAAAKSSYYVPGAATAAAAALATSIANEINERLGMEYNHEQEYEADEIAMTILKYTGRDTSALATSFMRMSQNMSRDRSSMMYFSTFTHPALIKRIEKIGKANVLKSDKEYEDRRFSQVLPLVSQNIDNGVATTIDYILKANCLLALNNDPKSNNEAMALVNKAKEIDAGNINVYKAEILTTLRLGKKLEAINLLKSYQQKMEEYYNSIKEYSGTKMWDEYHNFYLSESDWVKRMLIKLNGMTL